MHVDVDVDVTFKYFRQHQLIYWGNLLEKGPHGLDNQSLCLLGLILKLRSYGIQK